MEAVGLQSCQQSVRVLFPILANSQSCETFDLCQSAGWKMASGCSFHLTSLMLSEVEHLFSTQPYG